MKWQIATIITLFIALSIPTMPDAATLEDSTFTPTPTPNCYVEIVEPLAQAGGSLFLARARNSSTLSLT